jgi:dTDP-4-amino-4,6-dideoxygalactose transaminase
VRTSTIGVALGARLCEIHQRSHCQLIGNGTAGLALALRALGVHGGNVAIPNGVCPNVPMGVYFSGNQPVYLDVDDESLGLSVAALEACSQRLDAVIAVHAYGSVCAIDGLEAYCARHAIPLIEDAAVAMGAHIGGRPAGSAGAVSILSFGAGKIIDVGHGGAILTDDAELSRELGRLAAELPAYDERNEAEIDRFGKYHTQLYNAHYAAGDWAFAPEFKRRALSLREKVMSRFDASYREAVERELDRLSEIVKRREEKALRATELLARSHSDWMQVHTPAEGSVYWRLNLFLCEGRDPILKSLLRESLPISSWFPPVEPFFEGVRAESIPTPVSGRVGEQILNVWVNEQVDDDYYRRIAEILENAAELQ